MFALLLAAALAASPANCAYDKAGVLALSPDGFDQETGGGWRPLARRRECYGAAAELLASYRAAHWSTLTEDQLELNYWHEGQARAMAGQSREAVRLLLAGVGPDSAADFEDYALGTVAFLQRDRSALEAARRRLASQPQPTEWAALLASFKKRGITDRAWPPNLDVLDGLIACFDKPYAQAYDGDCRPPKPKS